MLWVYVPSLSYPACNAHGPFFVIFGLSGSTVFFYLINGTIFEGWKMFLNIKCVCLIFSANFVRNISHSEKNSPSYYHKCSYVFIRSARFSCQVSVNLEFSWQFFDRYSKHFMKIRPVGAELFHVERDRQTNTTKLIVSFRTLANVPVSWALWPTSYTNAKQTQSN